ncbi:hypothetical protein SMICM17S_02051 [Streptomyces microflavus]
MWNGNVERECGTGKRAANSVGPAGFARRRAAAFRRMRMHGHFANAVRPRREEAGRLVRKPVDRRP